MSISLKIVLLGIIQGLGEFLPISSSGHLLIGQKWLELTGDLLSLDIILHGGTLLALLIFFRQDILNLVLSIMPAGEDESEERKENKKLLVYILLASIPTAIIGLVIKKFFKSIFHSVPLATCGFFVTAAALLYCHLIIRNLLAAEKKQESQNYTYLEALLLGLIQGMAVIPGISRSGSTISFLYSRGYNMNRAGRISFLLSIPAVSGALLLEMVSIFKGQMPGFSPFEISLGFFISFITGYLSLVLLFYIFDKGKQFFLFGYYCLVLALLLTLSEVFNGI